MHFIQLLSLLTVMLIGSIYAATDDRPCDKDALARLRAEGGLAKEAIEVAANKVEYHAKQIELLSNEPGADHTTLEFRFKENLSDYGDLLLVPLVNIFKNPERSLAERFSALQIYRSLVRPISEDDYIGKSYAHDKLIDAVDAGFRSMSHYAVSQVEQFDSTGVIESRPAYQSLNQTEKLLLRGLFLPREFLTLKGLGALAAIAPRSNRVANRVGALLEEYATYRMIAGGTDESQELSRYFDKLEEELFSIYKTLNNEIAGADLAETLFLIYKSDKAVMTEVKIQDIYREDTSLSTFRYAHYMMQGAKYLLNHSSYQNSKMGFVAEKAYESLLEVVRRRLDQKRAIPEKYLNDSADVGALLLEIATVKRGWQEKTQTTAFERQAARVQDFLEMNEKLPWGKYERYQARLFLQSIRKATIPEPYSSATMEWSYLILKKGIDDFRCHTTQPERTAGLFSEKSFSEATLGALLQEIGSMVQCRHPEIIGLVDSLTHAPDLTELTQQIAHQTAQSLRTP